MGAPFRFASRVDDSQAGIASELRRCGVKVKVISHVRPSIGDLLCAVHPPHRQPVTFIVECKSGETQPPSKRRLSEAEQSFKDWWPGLYFVCERASDVPAVVVAACGAMESDGE